MKSNVLVLTLAILFSFLLAYSEACSCMPAHPQEHYCTSDFVILARVKRERIHNDTKIYKVRIRKEYKISEKGVLALKSGRLITSAWDSMCGIQMHPGKLYVISGRIHSLKAYVYLCNMVTEWDLLTRRQRKGLKLLYSHGCRDCQIRNCRGRKCYRTADRCNWTNDCETKEGVCQRQANNSCMWTRNRALAKCNKDWRRNHTITANVPKYTKLNLPYDLP